MLFVIDNSGTMGEEQLNLSAALPLLLERLKALTDHSGNPFDLDVNIMFTTTDVGHPECTALQPDGYVPAQGAPQSEACIERLDDFTGLGGDPLTFAEACTSGCPAGVEPIDPFIHFEGGMASVTNVPSNDLEGACAASPRRASTAAATRPRSRPCCWRPIRRRPGTRATSRSCAIRRCSRS